MTEQAVAETRRYRDGRAADLLSGFAELLAIPAASDDAVGLDRNAVWIRDELNAAGARAAVTQVPGMAPLVFGRIDGAPGGPHLGVYGRFDSRPQTATTPLSGATLVAGGASREWPQSGEPVDPGWQICCDGSVARAPVAAVVGALLARDGRRPDATIIFLLEGEAGIGSVHLPEYLGLLGGRLSADLWLALDGLHPGGESPVLMTGEAVPPDRVLGALEAAAGSSATIVPLPQGWVAAECLAGLGAPVAAIPIAGDADGDCLPVGSLWFAMDLVALLLG